LIYSSHHVAHQLIVDLFTYRGEIDFIRMSPVDQVERKQLFKDWGLDELVASGALSQFYQRIHLRFCQIHFLFPADLCSEKIVRLAETAKATMQANIGPMTDKPESHGRDYGASARGARRALGAVRFVLEVKDTATARQRAGPG
jgi:hypothetical protein